MAGYAPLIRIKDVRWWVARKCSNGGGGSHSHEDDVPNLSAIKKEVVEYIKEFNSGDKFSCGSVKKSKKNKAKAMAEILEEEKDKLTRKFIDENPRFYEIKNVYLLTYKGKDVLLFIYNYLGGWVGTPASGVKDVKEQVYCIVEYKKWTEIKEWLASPEKDVH